MDLFSKSYYQEKQKKEKLKMLFFWGHTPKDQFQVDKACFSQWFSAPFDYEGQQYLTAEHFMMAEKARLFHDTVTEAKIVAAIHPNQAKKLGREIKNFDDTLWNQKKYAIVVKGNYLKFIANPELAAFLLGTNDRILVEASPYDRIWGIGRTADDPKAMSIQQWRGENLLGFALMEVRQMLTRNEID